MKNFFIEQMNDDMLFIKDNFGSIYPYYDVTAHPSLDPPKADTAI